MKVQVFSDLHLDVLPIRPISIVWGSDAVIVAGDVCEGAVEAFGNLRCQAEDVRRTFDSRRPDGLEDEV